MIPTFDAADIVVRDEHHVIYRNHDSIGLEIFGRIDDVASQRWRDDFERELERAGHPDFYAIDGSRMEAVNSAGSRLKTALFVHRLMRRARHAVVFGTTKTRSNLVMLTLLRMAGVTNARFVATAEEFAAVLNERRG